MNVKITNILFLLLLLLLESNYSQDKSGYKYQAEGNEYSVIFSKKPKIKSSTSQNSGEFITAELLNNKKLSFQKCESLSYTSEYSEQINKEFVFSYVNNYATYTGLSYPEIHYEENDLGKVGTMRAFKELVDANGKKWKVTYFTKSIFGKYSAIVLYVGCPSVNYPTSEITEFLSSVKKEK
jgi:hypothetical protein